MEIGVATFITQVRAVAGALTRLSERLTAWRLGRKRGMRVPSELWSAAVEMVAVHGACRVAGELTTIGRTQATVSKESVALDAQGVQFERDLLHRGGQCRQLIRAVRCRIGLGPEHREAQ